jgi:putative tricarboxylic transport membrane protein
LELPDKEIENKQSGTAGTDIVSSLIVMAVAVLVSIWALKLSAPSGWSSAPGLVPIMFAGSMFLMGLGLFIAAVRRKGFTILKKRLSLFSGKGFLQDAQTKRSLWIIVLAAVYMLVLTGRLPFEIAGFLFLFSTFTVFWKKGRWLKIIIASIVVPLFFSLIFRFLFSILLPGDSIFDYIL